MFNLLLIYFFLILRKSIVFSLNIERYYNYISFIKIILLFSQFSYCFYLLF